MKKREQARLSQAIHQRWMLRERGTGWSDDSGTARCSLLLLLKEGHHRRAQGVPPGQEAASWGLGAGGWAPGSFSCSAPSACHGGWGDFLSGPGGGGVPNCRAAWDGQSPVNTPLSPHPHRVPRGHPRNPHGARISPCSAEGPGHPCHAQLGPVWLPGQMCPGNLKRGKV